MKIQSIRLQMVRENIGEYMVRDFKVSSPDSLFKIITETFTELENDTQENFGVVLMDTKNKIVGADIITRGTVNSSLISPRDIIQRALMTNAVSIAIFHNHPSGDTTPSSEDMAVTKRIKDACDIMGISLIDHLIIGDGCYRSFSEYSEL